MPRHRKFEGTGSDFIRKQSPELTTAAVIEAGAKVGLKLKENLVRIVRYKMRKAAGEVTPRKRGSRKGPFTRPTAPAQPKPASFTGKKRGRTKKDSDNRVTSSTELLDKYGGSVRQPGIGGNYAGFQPPELESSARAADTFFRIVTKIGTTKARALLDELEK